MPVYLVGHSSQGAQQRIRSDWLSIQKSLSMQPSALGRFLTEHGLFASHTQKRVALI
jgi:hypothetical protein